MKTTRKCKPLIGNRIGGRRIKICHPKHSNNSSIAALSAVA
jgi:hypothetical protein